MNLIDFCYVKDNSLEPELCDEIVNFFHSNNHLHERYDQNRRPNFTQLNFTSNLNLNPDLHNRLLQKTFEALFDYRSKVQESVFWQKQFGFEQFRIKHYQKGTEDQFDSHVDAVDKESSIRFLAFFWYLNDVDHGGETEFLNFDLTIQPRKGRLFMFPPMWMYPHRGNVAVSHDKYLLSSYLHFS